MGVGGGGEKCAQDTDEGIKKPDKSHHISNYRSGVATAKIRKNI